ncbi:ABC transporter permease [Longimicrobium terrae]|uniref:Putative permease n=1 Tax=Longimicrobium terrae TaxID=1639882 RepID=A0A841GWY6_9BACT|nr:ABC transporter permease [Longimicrobium terrae]MBB4634044.1 putative permease [Longimicrobium terrae]MBB6069066.1 putative permease [Longimicrobium terrae]NNC28241.1 ABC transporter permease [Longimicrobium terrae]
MDTLLQDLRYALRTLRRSPGFALVAVFTLALGIGLNTAIFSVVNGVLLRPLPFRDPDQLVRLHHTHPEKAAEGGPFSPQDLEDLQAGATGFEALAGYLYQAGDAALNLTSNGEPAQVQASHVSKEFFPVMGVNAALGRTLRPEENVPGADRVVVLSDAMWRGRFNADRSLVGRTITLQGEPFTVVGVMPPSFSFPATEVEAWVPISLIGEDDIPRERGLRWMNVVGRLRPGTSPEAALGSVNAVLARLAAEHTDTNEGWGRARLETLRDSVVGPVRPALLVLLGTVVLVLLVACANLANLLLARASARERELAVRTAMGAGRGRLVRQMLTESLVLALMGGVLGLLLAVVGVRALLRLSAGTIPRPEEVGIDARVAVFALLLSIVTAVLFGMVPALRAARGSTSDTLRDGGRGGSERRGGTTRAVLVMAQTAAAMVLLVGAGLLVKSFWKLVSVDPGFRSEQVLLASLEIPEDRYDGLAKNVYRNELIRTLGELPGVNAVGAAKTQPLQGGGEAYEFTLPGRTGADATMSPASGTLIVSPGYFSALGIPLLRGRTFEANDDLEESPAVLMIDQAASRRYWPGADPVGQTVSLGETPFTIIGVVGDVRTEGLAADPQPTVYFPFGVAPRSATQLFIRTSGDPALMAAAVRKAIHGVDPLQPLAEVRPLSSAMADTVAQPRFFTILLTLFGGVAVLLAALGLYGVVAYTVTRRKTEIGIRMALGARSRDVVQMVVGRSALPTGAGILVGAFGALLLTRLMASMLFQVRPADPATFIGAALLLGVVALVASWLPARGAARIEPTQALRAD